MNLQILSVYLASILEGHLLLSPDTNCPCPEGKKLFLRKEIRPNIAREDDCYELYLPSSDVVVAGPSLMHFDLHDAFKQHFNSPTANHVLSHYWADEKAH